MLSDRHGRSRRTAVLSKRHGRSLSTNTPRIRTCKVIVLGFHIVVVLVAYLDSTTSCSCKSIGPPGPLTTLVQLWSSLIYSYVHITRSPATCLSQCRLHSASGVITLHGNLTRGVEFNRSQHSIPVHQDTEHEDVRVHPVGDTRTAKNPFMYIFVYYMHIR